MKNFDQCYAADVAKNEEIRGMIVECGGLVGGGSSGGGSSGGVGSSSGAGGAGAGTGRGSGRKKRGGRGGRRDRRQRESGPGASASAAAGSSSRKAAGAGAAAAAESPSAPPAGSGAAASEGSSLSSAPASVPTDASSKPTGKAVLFSKKNPPSSLPAGGSAAVGSGSPPGGGVSAQLVATLRSELRKAQGAVAEEREKAAIEAGRAEQWRDSSVRLEQEAVGLRSQVEELTQLGESMEPALEEAKVNLENLQTILEEERSNAANVTIEKAQKEEECARMHDLLKQATSDVQELQQSLLDEQAQTQLVQEKLTRVEKEKSDLEGTIGDTGSQVELLRGELNSLRATNDRLNTELDQTKEEKETLEAELRETSESLAELKETADEFTKLREAREEDALAHKDELEAMRARHKEELTEAATEAAEAAKQALAQESGMKTLSRLRAQRDELAQKNEALVARVADSSARMKLLLGDLESLREEKRRLVEASAGSGWSQVSELLKSIDLSRFDSFVASVTDAHQSLSDEYKCASLDDFRRLYSEFETVGRQLDDEIVVLRGTLENEAFHEAKSVFASFLSRESGIVSMVDRASQIFLKRKKENEMRLEASKEVEDSFQLYSSSFRKYRRLFRLIREMRMRAEFADDSDDSEDEDSEDDIHEKLQRSEDEMFKTKRLLEDIHTRVFSSECFAVFRKSYLRRIMENYRKKRQPHLSDIIDCERCLIFERSLRDYDDLQLIYSNNEHRIYRGRLRGGSSHLVVIKCLPFGPQTEKQLVFNEISNLLALAHPAIISPMCVFEFRSEYAMPFIAMEMEYCDNDLLHWAKGVEPVEDEDLMEVLHLPTVRDLEEIKKILLQIAAGIEFIHGHSIIHRDLKPQNIMLLPKNEDGNVRIIDFGISKNENSNFFTSMGIGSFSTPRYRPPEEDITSSAADIYSFGLIAYELLVKPDDADFDASKVNPFPQYLGREACLLLDGMLRENPDERLSALEIVRHAFFAPYNADFAAEVDPRSVPDDVPVQDVEESVEELSLPEALIPTNPPVVVEKPIQEDQVEKDEVESDPVPELDSRPTEPEESLVEEIPPAVVEEITMAVPVPVPVPVFVPVPDIETVAVDDVDSVPEDDPVPAVADTVAVPVSEEEPSDEDVPQENDIVDSGDAVFTEPEETQFFESPEVVEELPLEPTPPYPDVVATEVVDEILPDSELELVAETDSFPPQVAFAEPEPDESFGEILVGIETDVLPVPADQDGDLTVPDDDQDLDAALEQAFEGLDLSLSDQIEDPGDGVDLDLLNDPAFEYEQMGEGLDPAAPLLQPQPCRDDFDMDAPQSPFEEDRVFPFEDRDVGSFDDLPLDDPATAAVVTEPVNPTDDLVELGLDVGPLSDHDSSDSDEDVFHSVIDMDV